MMHIRINRIFVNLIRKYCLKRKLTKIFHNPFPGKKKKKREDYTWIRDITLSMMFYPASKTESMLEILDYQVCIIIKSMFKIHVW